MNPARVDFAARNNAAWQDVVVLTLDGATFDFGDYAPLRMQVKVSEFAPLPELDLTDSDDLSIETDGALGINVAESLMTPLVGLYAYDLRGSYGGDEIVLMYGTMIVTQGITYP